ncbi:WG repeat protein [Paenibacillus taihuensis]|uniref:WG repeat protein n=1 Tax=Paenibacillus taihuensis TaxID=1156355 RepID=A0A3D9R2K8_9BACL|nr:WG repeat-containing protein [Paenibacillus taihuensis]REE69618.1 WG repeat protein [Paenibacillus taihuensis]
MTPYNEQLFQFASAYLPYGAELEFIESTIPRAAICAVDMNEDHIPETVMVYRLNGGLHLLALRYQDGVWERVSGLAAPGYGVTLMTAMPITRTGSNNLVIGWQVSQTYSKLSVYEWTDDGLIDIAPAEMHYSYLEPAPVTSRNNADDTLCIALWSHESGEAYRVEVVKWNGNEFVEAQDAYAEYYPNIARYYGELTRRYPGAPLYWEYLADAQYRASMSRAVGLYPASLKLVGGTKWGYIDGSGRMEIPARFDDANDFQKNGLAIVSERGKAGLINSTNRYVVQPIYDSIYPFSERRAAVIDKQGFHMINESGQVLTKRAYPYIADMRGGRSLFYISKEMPDGSSQSLYGYLDADGNEVIPAQYEDATDFTNGRAVVKIKENEYALINTSGRRLATYPFAYVGPYGDGMLSFQRDVSGKYGYIDDRGKIVIQPTYYAAMPFERGRAVVNTSADFHSEYGVINKKGEYTVEPKYNDVRSLGEERFALGNAIDKEQPFVGSIYAIADWNGKRLTDFIFNDVSDYQNGLASVSDTKQTYLIDRTGKPAQGYPRVQGRGSLTVEEGGIIKAFVDQRLSYRNRPGRIIWAQNVVIPLAPPYAVKEEKYNPNPDYLVYYPQVEGMADQAAMRRVNAKLKEMSQVKPIPPNQKLDYSYNGDFDVKFFKHQLLELELTGYNYPFGAAHGMPTQVYAILNLVSGRMFTLKDLFKPDSDYVKVLSDIVGRQIKEDPQYSYVFPDTYKGISPDQPFFVTENALHLYFNPYDIAPYAAGFVTFTIPFAQIRSIIDTNGEFWKSFHP